MQLGWERSGSDAVFVVLAIIVAWSLTRIGRVLFRVLLVRVARHAVRPAPGTKRRRSRRRADARDVVQLRQRHRVDAIALMLSRVASVVIWLGTLVATLHHFDVDIAVAVSSAGFVGLIVALGAQQSVQDYITGIHVLLEDRYSEGDDIEVATPSGQQVRGVVARLGAFSTQLQSGDITYHLANRTMLEIANFSQRGVPTALDIPVPAGTTADAVASAAQTVFLHEWPTSSIAVVDHVELLDEEAEERARVHVRSSRAITRAEQSELIDHTRRRVER
jgi:small-conductance mechanosensitive channel